MLKIIMKVNPSVLEETYSIDPKISPDEFLIEFGKKRNMLVRMLCHIRKTFPNLERGRKLNIQNPKEVITQRVELAR